MKTLNMRKWVLLLSAFVFIGTGCAEYDVKENTDVAVQAKAKESAMPETKQMHTAAEAEAAAAEAKVVMQHAEEMSGAWRDTRKLMKKADAALKQSSFDKAYNLALAAKTQAEMAINQTYLELANHKIGQAKAMMKKDDANMKGRINEAESAYLNDNGEKAYAMSMAMLEELENPQMAKAKTVKPMPAKKMMKKEELPEMVVVEHMGDMPKEMSMMEERTDDQYKVVSGDSLWGISMKPDIYANPYQWPLIYKANRQKIKDPDLIRPGQVLGIDRGASEAEISAAISHAKARGSWALGEVEEYDQVYLSGSDVAAR